MKPAVVWRSQRSRLQHEAGERQDQRLAMVSSTVEAFAFDLGLMIAGCAPSFRESATEAVAERLHASLTPFLDSGDRMRPDFGAFGELRIDGDLIAPDPMVRATLEFEDRSMRESADGRLIGSIRRRIRIEMEMSLEPCRVVTCRVHPLT
jgi:hypothetical protein